MQAQSHDKGPNAAAARAWGVRRALPGDAVTMRAAVQEVLASPAGRENSRAISRRLAGVDGARNAVDAIDALLSERLRKAA